MLSPELERYHTEQYLRPYESTAALADVIRAIIGDTLDGSVKDVGCGAGSVMSWLDAWGITTTSDFTGIDNDPDLLRTAAEHISGRDFACINFLDPLPATDYSLSVQVLSFIEDWRPALRELLASTRKAIIISSLFWEGVGTHTHASDGDKVNAHYNVIDTHAFEQLCERFGGRVEHWRRHTPQAQISAPHDQLRSRTHGGLTFSGPLLMPWAFAVVRKT